jgi:hypothetical protein
MKIFKLFSAIFLLGVIISCSKNNGTVKPADPGNPVGGVIKGTITGGRGVYVAGYEILYKIGADSLTTSTGTPRIAKIWKDGSPVNMSDGTYDAVANAVYANGTDVYAAGFELNKDGIQVATIWKNGVATRLGDGKNNSVANGVVLSGNDVYAAGNVTTGDNTVGTLWKNGAASAINGCRLAYSLFVENTNIYVAGQDAALLPAFWKNGTMTELLHSQNQDDPAQTVFVDNNVVYVGGQGLAIPNQTTDWYEALDTLKIGLGEYTTWTSELSTRVAMAWRDGVASNPTNGDEIVTIYAHNGLVILGGEQYNAGPVPTVWKNGLPTALNIGVPETGNNTSTGGYLNALSMNDKSVLYVAGRRSTFFNGDYLGVHTITVPLLWINGVPAVLKNGDSDATLKVYKKTGGRAQAIFIVN